MHKFISLLYNRQANFKGEMPFLGNFLILDPRLGKTGFDKNHVARQVSHPLPIND